MRVNYHREIQDSSSYKIEPSEELETIEVEILLEAIYRYYGFDYRDYSPSYLKRRIRHRQLIENLTSISALQEKVLHNPEMLKRLMNDLSINVTEMFRDPSFFYTLRKKIFPQLRNQPRIMIWQAGCSTGEESYSLAILLEEEGLLHKSMIYATDINEHYLEKGKKGRFSINRMQDYTRNYHGSGGTQAFSEYYKVIGDLVQFDPALNNNIVFAQHNLVTDKSFNEFDLIICRNVLIYFNKKLQNQVHELLHRSLKLYGYLGLGKHEEVAFTSLSNAYEVINNEEKIFRKIK